MGIFNTHDEAWAFVIRRHTRDLHGIHGPKHWAVVERNGLYLAESVAANPDVLSLFALFHDSRRLNDDYDPEHGLRGAEYAKQLRPSLKTLLPDDADFDRLLEACEGHTDIVHHTDPTIMSCWDADRLDLGRVYIDPNPKYLNTEAAKSIAESGDFSPLHERSKRQVEVYFS